MMAITDSSKRSIPSRRRDGYAELLLLASMSGPSKLWESRRSGTANEVRPWTRFSSPGKPWARRRCPTIGSLCRGSQCFVAGRRRRRVYRVVIRWSDKVPSGDPSTWVPLPVVIESGASQFGERNSHGCLFSRVSLRVAGYYAWLHDRFVAIVWTNQESKILNADTHHQNVIRLAVVGCVACHFKVNFQLNIAFCLTLCGYYCVVTCKVVGRFAASAKEGYITADRTNPCTAPFPKACLSPRLYRPGYFNHRLHAVWCRCVAWTWRWNCTFCPSTSDGMPTSFLARATSWLTTVSV